MCNNYKPNAIRLERLIECTRNDLVLRKLIKAIQSDNFDDAELKLYARIKEVENEIFDLFCSLLYIRNFNLSYLT